MTPVVTNSGQSGHQVSQTKKLVALTIVVLSALTLIASISFLFASPGSYGGAYASLISFVIFSVGVAWLAANSTWGEGLSLPPLIVETEEEPPVSETQTNVTESTIQDKLGNELKEWSEQAQSSNLKQIRERVSAKILRCFVSKASTLTFNSYDRNGCSVVDLPEAIGYLKHLQTLEITSAPKLTSLPKNLRLLNRLSVLSIRGSSLCTIPAWINQLKSLKVLNISESLLTTIPKELYELNQLEDLYLYGNQILALPEGITQLKKLAYVDIACNRLVALPNAFFECDKWTKIVARENCFQQDEILRIQNKMKALDYKGPTEIVLARASSLIESHPSQDIGRLALSTFFTDVEDQIETSIEKKEFSKLACLLWHGSYALNELLEYAKLKISCSQKCDPLEIYPAYPIKLKETLHLPIAHSERLVSDLVTERDLNEVEQEIKQKLSNEENFFKFLITNKLWIKLLASNEGTSEKIKSIKKLLRKNQDKLKELDELGKFDIDPRGNSFVSGMRGAQQEYEERLITLSQEVLQENLPPFLRKN